MKGKIYQKEKNVDVLDKKKIVSVPYAFNKSKSEISS